MNIQSPIATKEIANPTASAAGPQRCSEAAAPKTKGNNGITQGDRIERTPAKKARANAATYSAFSRSDLIAAGSVAPVERASSVLPL